MKNPQSATTKTDEDDGEMDAEETRETMTTERMEPTATEPTVAMDVDDGEDAGRMMDEKKKQVEDVGGGAGGVAEDERAKMVNPAPGVLPGDVRAPEGSAVHMTERQLYAFRQQIAAYAHICQQLLQVTSVQAHQQTAHQKRQVDSGMSQRPQVLSSVAHKMPGDHGSSGGGRGADKSARGVRWTGTPKHYEVLEQMFQNGQAPPVREELTRITAELAKYGTIGESNVYNWFQNRRSREKKIQAQALARAQAQQQQ